MKKVFFFAFIAIAAITLASFTTRHTSSIIKPYHSIAKKTADAQPYNIQQNFDLTGHPASDPCTGEDIVLSGSEHVDIHGVYNPTTGVLKDDFHANFQGISGVGQTTGNKYQYVGGSNERESYSADGCTLTESNIVNVNITTAGSNNNFYLKIRYTYTYNLCTGEYTVTRDVYESGCK